MYTAITLCICLGLQLVQGVSIESSLTTRLLQDYVVSARPVKNVGTGCPKIIFKEVCFKDSKAVDVSLSLTLQQIHKLSRDSLSATYWINIAWVDENLAWYTGDWDKVFENVI